MNACSLDLRKKIVEAKQRGTSTAEVARTFGVGLSTVKALRRHRTRRKAARPEEAPGLQTEARRSGEEAPASGPPRAPCGDAAAEARVSGACGGSTGERSHRLADARAYGMEPKKRSVGASERDEFLRALWRAMIAGTTQAERFVFVDECSTNVSLRSLYAWSPRGERAHCSAPR